MLSVILHFVYEFLAYSRDELTHDFKAISPAPEPVANNLTLQDMVKSSNNKTQQNTIIVHHAHVLSKPNWAGCSILHTT